MLRGFGLVLVLLAAGCGGADGPSEKDGQTMAGAAGMAAKPEPVCEAGKTETCPCLGGEMGVQSCDDDGSKWGVCECPAAPAKPDPPTEKPSEVCDGPLDIHYAAPSQGCPMDRPVIYNSCPDGFVSSGLCVLSGTGSKTCCPTE